MKRILLAMSLLTGLSVSGLALADHDHDHWHGHFGLNFVMPFPYFNPYYGPYYSPYYYSPPPVIVTPPQPQVYIQQVPAQSAPPRESYYWYHCDNPEGYYPYVHSCPDGWTRVVPTPPSGQ